MGNDVNRYTHLVGLPLEKAIDLLHLSRGYAYSIVPTEINSTISMELVMSRIRVWYDCTTHIVSDITEG